VVTEPLRLFSLLGRREHTMLCYGGADAGPADIALFEDAADAAIKAAHGRMDVYLIAAPDADVAGTVLPLIHDRDGNFAQMYSPAGTSTYVVRPDGYLSLSTPGVDVDALVAHLRATFA
jgi:pentachlorophenol monooxygenase